ncbi:hypothetical protein B1H10_02520 [candidate division KSB1 bacterium 4484_188]|nr:MAG: hypothetical protein B1H10_02520 [candidate division KSB1 bacterium 4484_188]
MEVKDSVALITGSSHRVGKQIALTLSEKGARVVIHYNSQREEALDVLNEIKSAGGRAIAVRGDISRRSDWYRMRERILQKWQRIDILVNNAAIFYRTGFFEITDREWDEFQNVNLKGTFLGAQIIGEIMVKNKSGKIINIADVAAATVWSNYIPYCVSKAGVVALTKGLAKALAPYVTVNAVSPGTVLLAENYDHNEEQTLIERTPLKRIGDPTDVAKTVLFLIEGSDFITGEIINVDGGRSIN